MPEDDERPLDLDLTHDELVDWVAGLSVELGTLRRRVDELEAPAPARMPREMWRPSLESSIASLDRKLAEGVIDAETHAEAVAALEAAERRHRDHPDGVALDVNAAIYQALTEGPPRHLHAVDDD